MKKILLLAANPKNTDQLRLDKEAREIEAGLKRSIYRDDFELLAKGAVRLSDFRRYMLEVNPQILHFSGHGAGEHGLVLEDDQDQMQLMPTEQLAGMFKLFASQGLECVVLNACYSEVQAQAIHQFVPYVIGMNQAIGDRAAIAFAIAFYDALGAGKSVEFAFELAKTQLIGLQEDQTLVLCKKPAIMPVSELAPKTAPTPSDAPPASPEQPQNPVNISMQAGDNAKQIGHIGSVGTINL